MKRLFALLDRHPRATAAAILVCLASVTVAAQAIIKLADGTYAEQVRLMLAEQGAPDATDADAVGFAQS